MENKRIELNRVTNKINLAFDVSDERMAEIYKKFIAVARINPNCTTLAEVFLNCDRFNEKEKLFGLMMLGAVFGMMVLVKRKGIRLKFTSVDLEGKLLSLLCQAKIMPSSLELPK